MIEKKLKRSAKKITMPDELKERILEKCDSTETAENEVGEEITFTVESFRPHRIRRIVSGIAAVAVAVGIAGYSGYLISRDGTPMGTETSTEITTEVAENEDIIIPFANLNGKMIHFNGYRGILPSCVLDETQSQKLSEFFSTVEWQPIPSDSPDTLATSPGVAGVNDMNFYYYDSEDTENTLEYLTVTLDGNCAVSHSVDEYDENGQLVSGHMYYYKIDETAFRDSIISMLYGDSDLAPPFDISTVNAYTSELDNRQLSEDESAMIADAFYGWNWSNEIDTPPENKPAYIFTDGNLFEIAVYEDDTVAVWSDDEYHCYADVSGNQGNFCLYLKIIFDEYADAYASNMLPFGDFAKKPYTQNGVEIPQKIRIQISEFFHSQIWSPLDTLKEGMSGVLYYFCIADNDCISDYIIIYDDNILEYGNAERKTYQYNIDSEVFNTNLSEILYNGCVTGSDAPFAENDGCTINFTGYREFIPGTELSETQAEKMAVFFSSLNWQEIEPPELKGRFYPTNDTISFCKYKDDYNYSLSFSMNNLNLATYNVSGEISLDNGCHRIYNETKYFTIDENIIREAVAMYLADGANMYTPFGTLYKMTDSIYCESDTYTGELTGDKLKDISTAFLGWDWSDASYTIIEGTPEYTFSGNNFTIYVYADGSVVWDGIKSADEQQTYVYYNNVDGDDDPLQPTGNLCLMIKEILMDNNPVVKIP